jgi:hypothetical protein
VLDVGLRNNEGNDLIDRKVIHGKVSLPLPQQNHRRKIMPKRFYDVMLPKILHAGV